MLRPVAERSLILVVDAQERLCAVMPEPRMRDLERSAEILITAARELRIPAMASEQYPKGLGPTIAPLAAGLERIGAPRHEKLEFSAWANSGIQSAITALKPETIVVLGMETHVCVFQTVRDLRASGYAVHVPVDGVVSRRDDHREVGLQLCERTGAILTTTETLVFEWLHQAGSPAFKALSRLIR